MERRGKRDLDAKLVRPMGLAPRLHSTSGRVQRIDLLSALMLALLARTRRASIERKGGEDALQLGVAFDLAHDVARDAAEIGSGRLQRPIGALELLGVGVALMGDQRMFLHQRKDWRRLSAWPRPA